LTAGLNFIVPFIDRISYFQTLKEQAHDVPSQSAITKDNIALSVDGVLYLKVLDAYKASYGVEDYVFAVTQLAQTTMRSEIGKIDLDKTFEERDALNIGIVTAINFAAEPWGVQVLRYEIKDIMPPQTVLQAMERQMKAEREKRAVILDSEGERQSAINVAEGEKRAQVLSAEADREQQILRAEGEAKAIEMVAEAKAMALRTIGEAAATEKGQKAVQLDLATGAIEAKRAIARDSTVVLMDGKSSEASHVVAEAIAIVSAMNKSEAFSGTASVEPVSNQT
jgi:regulator of protease activity HflC (stomatin/prohibitin superfamily)